MTSDLSVLDPRFPIRLSQPARIFWELTAEWENRETVIGETIRATQQHAVSVERFVASLPETAPMPAITAMPAIPPPPVVYRDLSEAELQRDWDTGPGTAILSSPRPARHRRRGPDGRFTRETS